MTGKVYRSKCCDAKIRTEGIPDFIGSKDVCTVSYVCRGCNNPCDVVAPKGQKQKMDMAKKRIQASEKRLDFQGKMLQKLVELLDGITIHPVKGVILTPKKKSQLAELKKIGQKLSKPKTKKSRRTSITR